MRSPSARRTNTSTVLQYVTNDRLDMCFEFDLSYATVGAVNDGDAGWVSAKADQVYNLYPYLQYATFLTNHDQDRVFTSVGENEGRVKAAAGIYLTMPGVPFVYYGEEIGMRNGASLKDEHKRKPMQCTGDTHGGVTEGTPWEPLHTQTAAINVADQTDDPDSLLSLYRELIRARRATPALHRGSAGVVPISSPTTDEVWALRRAAGDDTVICAFNLGESSALAVRIPGVDASGAEDLLTGEAIHVDGGELEVGDLGPRGFRYIKLLP